jgi:hypothetical protein
MHIGKMIYMAFSKNPILHLTYDEMAPEANWVKRVSATEWSLPQKIQESGHG